MKNALISVSNKKQIEKLALVLNKLEYKIFASRGTNKYLKDLGICTISIEDYTGFPEILGGRVKTLHPKIFGGILAKRDSEEQLEEVKKHNIHLFDFVCVDLYHFNEFRKQTNDMNILLDHIDIGGVSLIRASAKARIPILVDAKDYSIAINDLEALSKISDETLNYLTYKAFIYVSKYDEEIAHYFKSFTKDNLKYGENPHQKATYLKNENVLKKIHKGELSYNNILDLAQAAELCFGLKFYKYRAIIVKHGSPAGVGVSNLSIDEAFNRAWETDIISNYGGVLVVNTSVDSSFLNNFKNKFIELIAGPNFEASFLNSLETRKKLKVIELEADLVLNSRTEKRELLGISLFQEKDLWWNFNKSDFTFVTDNKNIIIEGLELAWSVVSVAKSNSVVISCKDIVLGIGSGAVSRLDASIIALTKAKELINRLKLDISEVIVSSDAFFPFPDSIELISKEFKVACVIQPGGSIRDEELIKYCKQNFIPMIFTKTRHFKH